MKCLFIFFITAFSISFSQVCLKKEVIANSTYEMIIDIDRVNYQIENIDRKNIIKFDKSFIDESQPDEFVNPKKSIFIAIPPNTCPKVQVDILESETINAIPETNPHIERKNDSTLSYSVSGKIINRPKTNFEFKGYLWIGNNYCAHVIVNCFSVNKLNLTEEVRKIKIILKFNGLVNIPLAKEEGIRSNRNSLIVNLNTAKYLIGNPQFSTNKSNDWIDYSRTYIKMGVFADGVYKITYSDFQKLGINITTIDPNTFKIYYKGKEIPIKVIGEEDNSFNSNDEINFVGLRNYGSKEYRKIANYGKPYNEFLDKYSDTSIYWLTWGGEKGKRIITKNNLSNSNAKEIEYYNHLVHLEDNPWIDFSMDNQLRREYPEWYENKTWVKNWGDNPVFNISNLYSDKSAWVYWKVMDRASDIVKNAHKVGLRINSDPRLYDTSYFDKYQHKVVSAKISSNILVNGNNTVNCLNLPTNASLNGIFHDWCEIEYPRYLIPYNGDSLSFKFTDTLLWGVSKIKITGITGNNIKLYQKKDDYQTFLFDNLSINNGTCNVFDTVENYSNYFLINSQKIQRPVIFYSKEFSNLSSNSNKAEYMLITHPMFKTSAEKYSEFIANSYNITTKLVYVNDIYDEFNYGFSSPEPIKEFLKTAYTNWSTPKVKYLLLLGDANYDYKANVTKFRGIPRQENYVPSYGFPVSDNWFVCWDTTGAYLPQILIGRLPVNSNDEVIRYLAKHKNNIEDSYDGWNKRFILYSGGTSDQVETIKQINEEISSKILKPSPIGGNVVHFYKTFSPITNFGPITQSEYQRIVDSGAVLISYLGHSGTQTWDNSIISPTMLNNKYGKCPLLIDFGCSTGKFAEPDIKSFSELFVCPINSQAIGYLGNSSLGFTSTAYSFPKIFLGTILSDSVYNIAQAHKLAKLKMLQSYGNTGSYGLFALENTYIGDPIISIKIPQKPNLKILNSNIKLLRTDLSDDLDSARFKIVYSNEGKVKQQTFSILITDKSRDQFIIKLNREIPLYTDSCYFSIPIKNKSGEHLLNINIDSDNNIDEITKSDNLASLRFIVNSLNIRKTVQYNNEAMIDKSFKLLNPSQKTIINALILKISNQQSGSIMYNITLDTFFTRIKYPSSLINSRFKQEILLAGGQIIDKTNIILGNKTGIFLNDSMSFNSCNKSKIFFNKGLAIDTFAVKLRVLSAGNYAGKTVIIDINGSNYIPEATKNGFHVLLLNKKNLRPINYSVYNYWLNSNARTDFLKLLDTVSSDKYVVITAMGAFYYTLTDQIRDKIKLLGSKSITQVVDNSSWLIVGSKGAKIGSVPEMYKSPLDGIAEKDTTFKTLNNEGNLTTLKIGPSNKWNEIEIQDSLPNNSNIKYRPIAYNFNEKLDTLNYLTNPLVIGNKKVFNISNIDSKKYKYLKISADFVADSINKVSPSLTSLGVYYVGLPELGMNYQVVSVAKDTVEQNEQQKLNFYVYNAGESRADSVKVKIEIEYPDNTRKLIWQTIVDSIGAEKRKYFSIPYSTAEDKGKRNFVISIDPDNKITEYFKDNNVYSIPFYVKNIVGINDSSINIVIKNNNQYENFQSSVTKFVSSKPEIKVELSNKAMLHLYDTSSITIKLNGNLVSYANTKEINYSFNNSNPQFVVTYTPTLTDGDYELTVLAKDASGNAIDPVTRNFKVSTKFEANDIYNFPNPFTGNTAFTCILTQIPDEMNISIYTVAGRKIKDIKKTSSELKYDYNVIPWDGKDQDGNRIANGVYFYKMTMKSAGKTISQMGKIAKIE